MGGPGLCWCRSPPQRDRLAQPGRWPDQAVCSDSKHVVLHLPRRLRENESGKGPCACGLPLSLHLFTMLSPPSHVPLDKMDRPHVVCTWLQELIVRRIREGGLAVEPPILARAFQARAPLSGRAPRTLPGGTAIAHIASLNHRPRTAAPDPLAAAVGVQEWLRAMPQGKHRGTSRYCPQCHLPVSSAFIAHKTSPLPAPPILHASDRGHAVPVPLGEPLHNLACFAAPPAIARGRSFQPHTPKNKHATRPVSTFPGPVQRRRADLLPHFLPVAGRGVHPEPRAGTGLYALAAIAQWGRPWCFLCGHASHAVATTCTLPNSRRPWL